MLLQQVANAATRVISVFSNLSYITNIVVYSTNYVNYMCGACVYCHCYINPFLRHFVFRIIKTMIAYQYIASHSIKRVLYVLSYTFPELPLPLPQHWIQSAGNTRPPESRKPLDQR